jgi:hypothetical protein
MAHSLLLLLLLLGIAFQTSSWPVSLTMSGVWGTAEAPVVIQRDPAADAASLPSFVDVVYVTNCSYVYFKDVTFRARNNTPTNIVWIANRFVFRP